MIDVTAYTAKCFRCGGDVKGVAGHMHIGLGTVSVGWCNDCKPTPEPGGLRTPSPLQDCHLGGRGCFGLWNPDLGLRITYIPDMLQDAERQFELTEVKKLDTPLDFR